MTYDQAIQQGYADQVKAVDALNCEIAQYQHPTDESCGVVAFTASHRWTAEDGYEYTITATYYQDKDDLDGCEDGDLGSLTWKVDHYNIS